MPGKKQRRAGAKARPSAFATDVRRAITDNPKRFISLFVITALAPPCWWASRPPATTCARPPTPSTTPSGSSTSRSSRRSAWTSRTSRRSRRRGRGRRRGRVRRDRLHAGRWKAPEGRRARPHVRGDQRADGARGQAAPRRRRGRGHAEVPRRHGRPRRRRGALRGGRRRGGPRLRRGRLHHHRRGARSPGRQRRRREHGLPRDLRPPVRLLPTTAAVENRGVFTVAYLAVEGAASSAVSLFPGVRGPRLGREAARGGDPLQSASRRERPRSAPRPRARSTKQRADADAQMSDAASKLDAAQAEVDDALRARGVR